MRRKRMAVSDYLYYITVALLCFAIAGMLALMISMDSLELYEGRFKGISMNPTLYEGETGTFRTKGYQLSHGDIVTFWCGSFGKELCKRVIGLPGDTIELLGDKVYRNGEALEEPYIIPCTYNDGSEPQVWHVEEDHIFVMGDNRPASIDSRAEEVGQIALGNVHGEYFYAGSGFPIVEVLKAGLLHIEPPSLTGA